MNIAIYNPYWSSLGGGEKVVTILGEVLSKNKTTNVTFLYAEENFSTEKLAMYYNADLSNVQSQQIKNLSEVKAISKQCDVLFALTNFRAIPSNAKATVFILQAPYGKINVTSAIKKFARGKAKESVKDLFRMQLLKRSKNISLVAVYSEYVRNSLLHHHNRNSFILSPPIDDFFLAGIKKEKIILSVGRIFAGLYNQKRYDITTKAFRELSKKDLHDWEYHIVGSVAGDVRTKKMVEQLQKENQNFPVHFHFNEPYAKLKEWYNRASIFWHAAGYEVDEEKFPERAEHFGMSTLEAMSANAVPIVVNKGGQKEIVQNGMNGFLWETTTDLKRQTLEVASNENLRNEISLYARKRFSDFDREHFFRRVEELMKEIL
ncbi:MAG: glycosyltransferase [Ignavibacteria bacterium]|nr:glycosyltransferase [Ignavibacteria bacterium]